jgi:hypothetical protein
MTPFSFLQAVSDLADLGTLSSAERQSGTERVLAAYYGDLGIDRLRRLVSCFRTSTRVTRDALRAALEDDILLDSAQNLQILLPVDFWDPRELTLNPKLLPLLAQEP